jgi:hypothetical protein
LEEELIFGKRVREVRDASKSRLFYKEIFNDQDSNNHLMTNYDLVNIYGNRKNFFSITAELSPERSSIIKEEIVAGNRLHDAKKTIEDGSRITNKAHIEWMREMSQNDTCRIFRS